jgi:hypothetical protein
LALNTVLPAAIASSLLATAGSAAYAETPINMKNSTASVWKFNRIPTNERLDNILLLLNSLNGSQ